MKDSPLFYYILPLSILAFLLYFIFFRSKSKEIQSSETIKEKEEKEEQKEENHSKSAKGPSLKELKKISAHSDKQQKIKAKKKIANPEHPNFVNSFKGFGDEITDWNIGSSSIVIASKDKTFKVFKLVQLKEEIPFFFMHNLGVNHATCINFSQFSEKFIICGLSNDKTIEIFEMFENEPSKKYFSSIKKFTSNIHKEEVKNAYYLNNSCIVTFGGGMDTTIKVWNFKNELLNTIDTKQVKHFDSILSHSGKFLMAGTWSPDVKIFEVKLEKDKNFKSIAKVMNLGDHKAGVFNLSCSLQENRVVTISSDNFLRVWNINVEYEKKGDPKCLFSLNMKSNDFFSKEVQIKSADIYFDETNEKKQILAVSETNNIIIISLNTLKVIESIDRAHSENDIIKSLKFKEIGGGLALMSCGTEDSRINVFKVKV